jgi:glycosyltransferase involved in cell wall biosynthesis
LLAIDDGSTDRTLERLREVDDQRIRIRHDGRNRGLPTRLNEAVADAAGEVPGQDGRR